MQTQANSEVQKKLKFLHLSVYLRLAPTAKETFSEPCSKWTLVQQKWTCSQPVPWKLFESVWPISSFIHTLLVIFHALDRLWLLCWFGIEKHFPVNQIFAFSVLILVVWLCSGSCLPFYMLKWNAKIDVGRAQLLCVSSAHMKSQDWKNISPSLPLSSISKHEQLRQEEHTTLLLHVQSKVY